MGSWSAQRLGVGWLQLGKGRPWQAEQNTSPSGVTLGADSK